MIVAKRTGAILVLLLSFQSSSLGDTTRVEAYHNSKHHHGPSRSDIDRSHRYLPRHSVKGYDSTRVGSRHRSDGIHTSQHLRPSPRHVYRFRHGGHRYRYSEGLFYRSYNHGFRVVQAPIGAVILSLPIGYRHMRVSDRDYYRYHDVYYQREFGRRGYRVVENPYSHQRFCYHVGEMVNTLPLGASEVIIDNVRYYEHDNYYFRPQRRNGVRMYLVVDF